MGRHTSKAKAFTDKYIQSIKPAGKLEYTREGRGFALRILPSGLKTFFYMYTQQGKQKYLNLGNYPETSLAEARVKYTEAYNKQQAGIPVVQQLIPVVKQGTLFKDFCKAYLIWSKAEHSDAWYKTVKLSLENDVLPIWGELDVTAIRRRDAIALLETIQARSRGQVANVHKAARGVLDYAVQREYLEYNVMLRLNKVVPSLKNIPRVRVLSEAEIQTVWTALDDTPSNRAIKLILVTAQRPGEVAGLHAKEIQGDTWTIPPERAEKGQGAHRVYLTETAKELIGQAEGLVFDVKRNSLSQVISREKKYMQLPRWTPHDLRRTARTYMAKLGVPEEHAEAVLAHCKQGMKKVYNQYEYQEEKKAALLKWEAELLRILACTT